MQRRADGQCGNLTDLVKNIVLGFCKINVPYVERLDVYGSVHIRADDCDVANFMLNEHCYNSRASSPTVTSGQPIDQESAGNDADSRDGHVSQRSQHKLTVKPETSVENDENQRSTTDWSQWQWSDTESAAIHQKRNFSQPFHSINQPVGDLLDQVSHDSSGVPQNCVSSVKGHAIDVKCENFDSAAAVNDDQLSNDGSVEILDDDNTDYINDDNSGSAEYKPDFLKREEEYDAEMTFGCDDFDQCDDSSASVYQYTNVSSISYPSNQPYGGNRAKKPKPSVQHVLNSKHKICAHCQEGFVSDAELSTHFQRYHQCTAPPARQSRKTSSRLMDQLPDSIVNVSSEENVVKMYKCRFCGQLYRSQDGLRNHENVKHSRNKRYQCNFCSQEFLTRQAAYTHRIKFHRLLSRKMQ